MQEAEQRIFQTFKAAIAARYLESFPRGNPDIREWKGQEIVNFQEDLSEKVNGRISEKWFYTHLKSADNERLPRIDVLNMLSRYVGMEDWNQFVETQGGTGSVPDSADPETVVETDTHSWKPGRKRMPYLIYLLLLVVFSGFWLWPAGKKNRFCIVDAYTQQAITEGVPEIWWIKQGESPMRKKIDQAGCFSIRQKVGEIQLVVKAPYYRQDTFNRRLPLVEGEETLVVYPDDYARMLHYYSTSNMRDWKKRRAQLDEIFADQAKIFQVEAGSDLGMEMYNKEEFIMKLCLPLNALQNIEILEIQYAGDRISRLRFKQASP